MLHAFILIRSIMRPGVHTATCTGGRPFVRAQTRLACAATLPCVLNQLLWL